MAAYRESEEFAYTTLSPREYQRWTSRDIPFMNGVIEELQERGRAAGLRFWWVQGDGDFDIGNDLGDILPHGDEEWRRQ